MARSALARTVAAMTSSSDEPCFHHILAGVDGDDGGRDALALAALLQRAGGGRLTALYAYPYDRTVHLSAADAIEAVLPEDLLAKVEVELHDAGIHARAMVVTNPRPAHALHAVAERDGADVIVVGSSHLAGADRVLAGDDAMNTLHGAPCAVAVAPRGFAQRAAQLQTIGAAFNGSPEAHAALVLAARLARRAGAEVQSIAVVNATTMLEPYAAYSPEWPDYTAAALREAQERVDRATQELGLPAGEVIMGSPAAELTRRSAQLDLLVLGSRGYGPLRRLLLGSTSTQLARHAACPVLVLPRGVQDPRPDVQLSSPAGARHES